MCLFILDWASQGVWPHNLILLAETGLWPSANFSTLFRSEQSTTSPQWDLNVPQIIQNVKVGVTGSAKVIHTSLPKGFLNVEKCIFWGLKRNMKICKTKTLKLYKYCKHDQASVMCTGWMDGWIDWVTSLLVNKQTNACVFPCGSKEKNRRAGICSCYLFEEIYFAVKSYEVEQILSRESIIGVKCSFNPTRKLHLFKKKHVSLKCPLYSRSHFVELTFLSLCLSYKRWWLPMSPKMTATPKRKGFSVQ